MHMRIIAGGRIRQVRRLLSIIDMAFVTSAREWMSAGALIAGIGLFGGLACTDTPEPQQTARTSQSIPSEPSQKPLEAIVPETAADRLVREQLHNAIERDSDLKDREISFSVDNGDVTVTGHVRSEAERQKINELAMQLPGVKSVANALRVSPP